MSLRLGSVAPDFSAASSAGHLSLYSYMGSSWLVFFSHPDDFTPVCTTELGAFATLQPEFEKRNTKLLGLSANTVERHLEWIKDINEITGCQLSFPIIADPERRIATLYDQIDYQDATNVDDKGVQLTIRLVYIIDPAKKIRLIIAYPASVGRNTAEILRVLDSLQLSERLPVTTPVNWIPGDDVIVHPNVDDEEAKRRFGGFRLVKNYLRLVSLKGIDRH